MLNPNGQQDNGTGLSDAEIEKCKHDMGYFDFIHVKSIADGKSEYIAKNAFFARIGEQPPDHLREIVYKAAENEKKEPNLLTTLMCHLIEEYCREHALSIYDIRRVLFASSVRNTSSVFEYSNKKNKRICVNLLKLPPTEISTIYERIVQCNMFICPPVDYCPLPSGFSDTGDPVGA